MIPDQHFSNAIEHTWKQESEEISKSDNLSQKKRIVLQWIRICKL
jgi:hypothetical protein